jgi:phytoene dehydrogenase-like protein
VTDAVVVGSGPNGLAAALELARNGRSVTVYEANDTIGGGSRSSELTLPGFVHDICSAIHPLARASPFFRQLPLAEHGVEWIDPPLAFAHPLDDGTAAVVRRSIDDTARELGADAAMWRRTVGAIATEWPRLEDVVTGPIAHLPRHPIAEARFGALALLPFALFARLFRTERARALLAGATAHSFLPFEAPITTAFAIVMAASGHAVGWPVVRGGSQRLADALAAYLRALGGTIETRRRVVRMKELPPARAYLFDTSPRDLERIAGGRLSDRYRAALRRYRYGPAVFKVDYALAAPVPWRASECRDAGTVHLGGTYAEIARSEREVSKGLAPERPFVLVAQQSLFDATRAPAGKHTLWAYCHVPNGSSVDMTARIDAQIERFAPGFRDLVLARAVTAPAEIERHNANYVGGDISCGSHGGTQFLARPTFRIVPYDTSAREIFLCSAATPPGGGAHGMCGYHAARRALARVFAGSAAKPRD